MIYHEQNFYGIKSALKTQTVLKGGLAVFLRRIFRILMPVCF